MSWKRKKETGRAGCTDGGSKLRREEIVQREEIMQITS
jgi:hypothetical protein